MKTFLLNKNIICSYCKKVIIKSFFCLNCEELFCKICLDEHELFPKKQIKRNDLKE